MGDVSEIEEIIQRYAGAQGNVDVYAISAGDGDPLRPENCRYIGLTSSGIKTRLSCHVASSLRVDKEGNYCDQTHRARWMRKVIKIYGRNHLKIKTIVSNLECNTGVLGAGRAENELINAYRKIGAKLTNIRAGGAGTLGSDGDKRVTKNEYQKKYQADRRVESFDFIEMQRTANRKSAKTKYWSDADYRASQLARYKARRDSDEAFRLRSLEYGRAYRAMKKQEKMIANA